MQNITDSSFEMKKWHNIKKKKSTFNLPWSLCGLSELERPLLFNSSSTIVRDILTSVAQPKADQRDPDKDQTFSSAFLLAVVKKKKKAFHHIRILLLAQLNCLPLSFYIEFPACKLCSCDCLTRAYVLFVLRATSQASSDKQLRQMLVWNQ